METKADLDNLLLWLGPDRSTGSQRYVEVRKKLVVLFEYRGCTAPEDLADKTLDRTARAILKPGFTFDGNPIAYLRGVARNVYLESLRESRTVSHEGLPELADTAAQVPFNSGVEELSVCLDQCLAELPGDKRALLLRYYQGDKSAKIDGRLQQANEEGIALNTLRIQVFRLRKAVRECVERCARAREMKFRF
jgi:DNA-directed RNA polymerase specialized sigma24 family protein